MLPGTDRRFISGPESPPLAPGATPFAPENTVAAFRKAVEMGADLVEMDIRETKDGRLVIMHDVTVDRTTNGKGRVTDLTLAEIQKLDAGSWFDKKFAGERVPTLEQALDSLGGQALPDVDFKAGTPERLVAVLGKFKLLGKVTLYCGEWDLLRQTLEVSREFRIRPTKFRWAAWVCRCWWRNSIRRSSISIGTNSARGSSGTYTPADATRLSIRWGRTITNSESSAPSKQGRTTYSQTTSKC